jgi:hypothetical protein
MKGKLIKIQGDLSHSLYSIKVEMNLGVTKKF